MEIGKKMQDALNRQINRELYSGYLYLSMAAYLDSMNLKGFSHWMRAQAGEEKEHAMRIYDHVYDRGGEVALEDIEAPPKKWKSPLDAFQQAYEHEKKVTKMIDDLSELAATEKERATEVFLHWFVNEQVEEEDSTNEIVQKLRMIGESKNALLMLDRHLGERK